MIHPRVIDLFVVGYSSHSFFLCNVHYIHCLCNFLSLRFKGFLCHFLIRKCILWEDNIYSLQSWKGPEYNCCLVLSGKFDYSPPVILILCKQCDGIIFTTTTLLNQLCVIHAFSLGEVQKYDTCCSF